MDPCKCWKESVIVIRVRHCPSLDDAIKEEVDKIVTQMNSSKLTELGKVKLEVTTNEAPLP